MAVIPIRARWSPIGRCAERPVAAPLSHGHDAASFSESNENASIAYSTRSNGGHTRVPVSRCSFNSASVSASIMVHRVVRRTSIDRDRRAELLTSINCRVSDSGWITWCAIACAAPRRSRRSCAGRQHGCRPSVVDAEIHGAHRVHEMRRPRSFGAHAVVFRAAEPVSSVAPTRAGRRGLRYGGRAAVVAPSSPNGPLRLEVVAGRLLGSAAVRARPSPADTR